MGRTMIRRAGVIMAVAVLGVVCFGWLPALAVRRTDASCAAGVSHHLNKKYAKWATDVHTASLCVDPGSVQCVDREQREFSVVWTARSTTDEDDEVTTLSGAPFAGFVLPGVDGSADATARYRGDVATARVTFNWFDGDSDGGYDPVTLTMQVPNRCEPPTTTTAPATSTTTTPTTIGSTVPPVETTAGGQPTSTLPDTTSLVTAPTTVPATAERESTTSTATSVKATFPPTTRVGRLPQSGPPGEPWTAIAALVCVALGAMLLVVTRRPRTHRPV